VTGAAVTSANGIGRHIRQLDHIGIATTDMPAAAALFTGVLGATLISGGDNDSTGIRLMQLACGGFKVELMQPLRGDSLISPRLATYGPGFHHLTFAVDDIVATIDDLAELAGVLPGPGADLRHAAADSGHRTALGRPDDGLLRG
jgi:methylmalonyl-CoA/ethylmalonyl-CoA epimerase